MGILPGIGMLFGSLSSKIALGLGISMAVLVGLGYFYFNYTNHKIADLQSANGSLTKSLNDDNATISGLQAQAAQQALIVNQLQQSLGQAAASEQELIRKINGTNINVIAQTDNKAATDILNNTSQDIINSITASTTVGPAK